MTESVLKNFRGRNALLNLFELWVGLAGMISCLVYYLHTGALDKSSLSVTYGHHFALVWSTGYGLAGLLIWIGLLKPTPRWEVVGLSLLGSATALNGLAILYVFRMQGAATAITFLTLTIASWGRAALVFNRAMRFAEDHRRAIRN